MTSRPRSGRQYILKLHYESLVTRAKPDGTKRSEVPLYYAVSDFSETAAHMNQTHDCAVFMTTYYNFFGVLVSLNKRTCINTYVEINPSMNDLVRREVTGQLLPFTSSPSMKDHFKKSNTFNQRKGLLKVENFDVIENVQEVRPDTAKCRHCGTEFKYRKNKLYCGKTCTKAASRAEDKKSNPLPQYSEIYRYTRTNELAYEFVDRYYTMPKSEREAYILQVLNSAMDDKTRRDLLTSPNLLKPNLENRWLFWKHRAYDTLTISEIVNRYCKLHLKRDIRQIMKQENRENRKEEFKPKGVDMSKLDTRFGYKSSEIKHLTEAEIDEKFEARDNTGPKHKTKQWVMDYYKSVMHIDGTKHEIDLSQLRLVPDPFGQSCLCDPR